MDKQKLIDDETEARLYDKMTRFLQEEMGGEGVPYVALTLAFFAGVLGAVTARSCNIDPALVGAAVLSTAEDAFVEEYTAVDEIFVEDKVGQG